MARTSRQLMELGLPCSRDAALAMLRRLEARLSAEAAYGALMAALSVIGVVLSLMTLNAPTAYRVGYAGFFLSAAAASLLYRRRRIAERHAVERLRTRLEAQPPRLDQELCDKTLGQLLEEALRGAAE